MDWIWAAPIWRRRRDDDVHALRICSASSAMIFCARTSYFSDCRESHCRRCSNRHSSRNRTRCLGRIIVDGLGVPFGRLSGLATRLLERGGFAVGDRLGQQLLGEMICASSEVSWPWSMVIFTLPRKFPQIVFESSIRGALLTGLSLIGRDRHGALGDAHLAKYHAVGAQIDRVDCASSNIGAGDRARRWQARVRQRAAAQAARTSARL